MRHLVQSLIIFVLFVGCAAATAGSLCGNARLDAGETCDDGNATGGDGCSSVCITEPGFQCTAPFQPLDSSNLVRDGGFEMGNSTPFWNLFSAAFGTPLCTVAACPNDPGSRQGAWWARFGFAGGADQGVAEQDVIIDNSASLLRFSLQKHSCGANGDLFRVYMDNTIIYENNGSGEGCFENNYTMVDVDLSTAPGGPYNDNEVHTLKFEGRSTGQGAGSSFSVDEVIIAKPAGGPFPGICSQASDVSYLENFDPPTGGDLDQLGFTQVLVGQLQLPWGTTDDGFCGSGDIPPGNFTGGEGEAACIDASFSGPGQIESYLCTPELDFSNTVNNVLSLLVNFQSTNQQQDFFSILVGTEPPDAGSIGSYSTVFFTNESLGEFAQPFGIPLTIGLSDFDFKPQVWICLGFGGKGSLLYAQADDVVMSFEDCIDEFDNDKLDNCNDNCITVSNFSQRDTDNDGYGNACDSDITGNPEAGQALGNGNDCRINFLDLGTLKESFFATPADGKWNPDADFNGDNRINFEDLGLMKNQFFNIPGPSGFTSVCLAPI